MAQCSTLDRLSALDTNAVSDALDVLGLKGAMYRLRPLWNCPKIVGRASTVKIGLKPDAVPTAHPVTPILAEATTDAHILVISGGIDGVSCCDDIIENTWKPKRIRGAVINGWYRDTCGESEDGCPVYGRAVTKISGCNQETQVDFGTQLQMQGVLVRQDDYVIADSSGTVFVPAEHVEQVLEVGRRISRCRSLIAQAVEGGRPVSEVMNDPQFENIRDGAPPLPEAVSSDSKPKKANVDDQALVALFAGVDTAAVSDALDKLGISGQALGIMPLVKYETVTVGVAFTVRYVPAGQPAGSVGNFMDDVAEGNVIVIDNGGRRDCTVWGDIMTQYAGLRGIAGTVIDGVCRDVNRAITENYPLFTVGHWMRTGKDRVELAAIKEPVGIGGVRVKSRDIVVADANGVVFVPRDRAREVAEVAQWVEQSEDGIRKMIAGGATLAKAREAFKYHQLQRTE